MVNDDAELLFSFENAIWADTQHDISHAQNLTPSDFFFFCHHCFVNLSFINKSKFTKILPARVSSIFSDLSKKHYFKAD